MLRGVTERADDKPSRGHWAGRDVTRNLPRANLRYECAVLAQERAQGPHAMVTALACFGGNDPRCGWRQGLHRQRDERRGTPHRQHINAAGKARQKRAAVQLALGAGQIGRVVWRELICGRKFLLSRLASVSLHTVAVTAFNMPVAAGALRLDLCLHLHRRTVRRGQERARTHWVRQRDEHGERRQNGNKPLHERMSLFGYRTGRLYAPPGKRFGPVTEHSPNAGP